MTSPQILTPPELAKRWGIKPESARKLIECGRLSAFNVADPLSSRPRWRIRLDAVEAFERGEQPKPLAKPARRGRRRSSHAEGPF